MYPISTLKSTYHIKDIFPHPKHAISRTKQKHLTFFTSVSAHILKDYCFNLQNIEEKSVFIVFNLINVKIVIHRKIRNSIFYKTLHKNTSKTFNFIFVILAVLIS